MGIVLHPPPAPAAIVIRLDTGGYVDEYFAAADLYKSTGRRIEVRGECRSACTIMLEVPTLCVAPGAVFRWHHAYTKETGALHPEVTNQMLSRLPPQIRARLQGKISKEYTAAASLGYKDLVALGVKDCERKTSVARDRQPFNPFRGLLSIFR